MPFPIVANQNSILSQLLDSELLTSKTTNQKTRTINKKEDKFWWMILGRCKFQYQHKFLILENYSINSLPFIDFSMISFDYWFTIFYQEIGSKAGNPKDVHIHSNCFCQNPIKEKQESSPKKKKGKIKYRYKPPLGLSSSESRFTYGDVSISSATRSSVLLSTAWKTIKSTPIPTAATTLSQTPLQTNTKIVTTKRATKTSKSSTW